MRKAVETSVQLNPNPYDSEPYYNLGLCLEYLGKTDEAYTAFYKATWSNAWQDAAFFSLAQIDIARKNFELALQHINQSLDKNTRNSKAYVLKAVVLRKLRRFDEAILVGVQALKYDAFNLSALFEKMFSYKALQLEEASHQALNKLLELSRAYSNNFIEYALDYAVAGLYTEAIDLLSHSFIKDTSPMVDYHLAYFHQQSGDSKLALNYFKTAANTDSYLCFPNRLEDIRALQAAIKANPKDARAPYYLGNLWYDKRQYDHAISNWELSADRDPTFPTVFRNLGIAFYNKRSDTEKALQHFEKAFLLDKTDARVLMELDQLYKRINKFPETRLHFLEKNLATVEFRDDLYLERLSMYNFLGEHDKALDLIMTRKFHPWEGGEGKVSEQYRYALIEIAKKNLEEGNFSNALMVLNNAQKFPHNLGEGKLYGAMENDIFYWLGCTYQLMDDQTTAKEYFQKATLGLAQPGVALFYNDQQPDKIFYQGLAWLKLAEIEKANAIFLQLKQYGENQLNKPMQIDYFAVSLPDLLIFEDDLNLKNNSHAYYIKGLGCIGLQQYTEAEASFSSALNINNSFLAAHSAQRFATNQLVYSLHKEAEK